MSTEMIGECLDLSKSFGHQRVLQNCNLVLHKGELLGLVGENGSGKSTFVKCLLGYLKPDSGSIILHGSVGYCPQEEIINRTYTVAEHFAFIGDIYAQHCSVDANYVNHLISEFRLKDYMNELIATLSGGTRQKIQFITSIMHQPRILLLDEPYGGFDWEMYLTFWKIIEEMCQLGTGVVLITHFVYDNKRFNKIYKLKNGVLNEAN